MRYRSVLEKIKTMSNQSIKPNKALVRRKRKRNLSLRRLKK
jgi:hypothetical protein